MRKSRRKNYDGERNMQRLWGKEELGMVKEQDESSRRSGMGEGKNELERWGLKRRNVKEKRGKGRKRGRKRRGS